MPETTTVPTSPGSAKYSVVLESSLSLEILPNQPDSRWKRKELFATEEQIKAVFGKLEEELIVIERATELGRTTSIIPEGFENKIRVYFNPQDMKSLLIVAKEESDANVYARFHKLTIPYPHPLFS